MRSIKRCFLTKSKPVYEQPPTFSHLLLAQWFENVHINVVLGHLDELKGVITSTYGRILKLDSTKSKLNLFSFLFSMSNDLLMSSVDQ